MAAGLRIISQMAAAIWRILHFLDLAAAISLKIHFLLRFCVDGGQKVQYFADGGRHLEILPLLRFGGRHIYKNVQALCPFCESGKKLRIAV